MAIINDHLEARNGLTVSGDILVLPSNAITNTNFTESSSGRLASSKVVAKQQQSVELAEQSAAVVAVEKLLFIANGNGTFDKLEACAVQAATGADRTVDIDVLKSTAGGSFASVLTTTLELTDGNTDLVPVEAVFTTTAYIKDDVFKITVAVAGAAGAQAVGLIATATKSENPN